MFYQDYLYQSKLKPLIDSVDSRMSRFEQTLKSIYQTSDHPFWFFIFLLLTLKLLFSLPVNDHRNAFYVDTIPRMAQLFIFIHYIVILLTWYHASTIVQSSTEVVISHRPYRSDHRRRALSLIVGMMLLDIAVTLSLDHVDRYRFIYYLTLIFINIQLDRELLIDHPLRRPLRFLFYYSQQPSCRYVGLSLFRIIRTDRPQPSSETLRFRYLDDLIQTITYDSHLRRRMLSLFIDGKSYVYDRPIIQILVDDLLTIAKSYEKNEKSYPPSLSQQDHGAAPTTPLTFCLRMLAKAYAHASLFWVTPYSRTALAIALNNACAHAIQDVHAWPKQTCYVHASHIQSHQSESALQSHNGDSRHAERPDSSLTPGKFPRTRSVDQLASGELSNTTPDQSASHTYATDHLLSQVKSFNEEKIALALACLSQSCNLIEDCNHCHRHQRFIIVCNYLSALISASRIDCLSHTQNTVIDTVVQALRQSQLISERDDLRLLALFTMGHYYRHSATTLPCQHRQKAETYFSICQNLLPELVDHDWMTDDLMSQLSESIHHSASSPSP